jgi:hypothetical protein
MTRKLERTWRTPDLLQHRRDPHRVFPQDAAGSQAVNAAGILIGGTVPVFFLGLGAVLMCARTGFDPSGFDDR